MGGQLQDKTLQVKGMGKLKIQKTTIRKLNPFSTLRLLKSEQPLFIIATGIDLFICHEQGDYRGTAEVNPMYSAQNKFTEVHVYIST